VKSSANKGKKPVRPKKKERTAIPANKETASFIREMLSLFEPHRLISPAEWQEEYRIAPPGSPVQGRWRNYPFQVEPLNCAADPNVSSVTLEWASQFLGKSSIVEGIIGWLIDQRPTSIVCVHPTFENAAAWSKNRLGPLIESTPCLSNKVDSSESRKGKRTGYGQNTVHHKKFSNGWLIAGGANSPANLRAHTAEVTVFEELDAYPESAGEDGDVILLTEQRSAKFPKSFSIKSGTPTVRHFSRIDKEIEGTDKRHWHVNCIHCSHEFVINWINIQWPKLKDKDGKKTHRIEDAHIECPSCGEWISEDERVSMVCNGRWVPHYAEITQHRGYVANAFMVLGPCKRGFKSWCHYFAWRWMQALRLGTNGIRTFQNLVCGESYEIESTKPPEYRAIYDRREEYLEVDGELILPERSLFLTVGADVQLDRIEAEVLAWGLDDETWGIEYKAFRGNPETPALWNEFDQWIQKKWLHPSGHKLWPACTLIDSGNKPHAIYDYSFRCAPRQVYASKGERGYIPNWVSRSTGRNQRLFILKVDSPKESLYSRLKLTEYGPGYQHFPSNARCGFDPTYFEQLCSESMKSNYIRGRFSPYFEVTKTGARNESLDIRILGMAAKEILNPDYAAVQASLAAAPLNDWRPKEPLPLPTPGVPEPNFPTKPEPQKNRSVVRPRRGWLSKY
jgi:phage terminase large subunit GpA-like protein